MKKYCHLFLQQQTRIFVVLFLLFFFIVYYFISGDRNIQILNDTDSTQITNIFQRNSDKNLLIRKGNFLKSAAILQEKGCVSLE
jgi:hypothetical protein